MAMTNGDTSFDSIPDAIEAFGNTPVAVSVIRRY